MRDVILHVTRSVLVRIVCTLSVRCLYVVCTPSVHAMACTSSVR